MFLFVDYLGFLENILMHDRWTCPDEGKLKQCTQSTLRPFSLCGESAEAQAIFMNTHRRTHIYIQSLILIEIIPYSFYTTHSHTLFLTNNYTPILANGSAQNVQVNRRGLGQALEQVVDFFDVESHVRLPLPAAQHQVIHLFGARTRSLQHPALCDTLDHLQEAAETRSRVTNWTQAPLRVHQSA